MPALLFLLDIVSLQCPTCSTHPAVKLSSLWLYDVCMKLNKSNFFMQLLLCDMVSKYVYLGTPLPMYLVVAYLLNFIGGFGTIFTLYLAKFWYTAVVLTCLDIKLFCILIYLDISINMYLYNTCFDCKCFLAQYSGNFFTILPLQKVCCCCIFRELYRFFLRYIFFTWYCFEKISISILPWQWH